MSSKGLKYVWKFPKPTDPRVAAALKRAAYHTAMATDPLVREILIRSPIHSSTFTRGAFRPDGPHITIATKNRLQQLNNTHEASHGYTQSASSTDVVSVNPSKYVKADETVDKSGREIWPKGLPSEGGDDKS